MAWLMEFAGVGGCGRTDGFRVNAIEDGSADKLSAVIALLL